MLILQLAFSVFGHSGLLIRAQLTRKWFVPVYVSCLLAATRPERLGHELRQTSRRLSA